MRLNPFAVLGIFFGILLLVGCRKKYTFNNAQAYDPAPYFIDLSNQTLVPPSLPSDNPLTQAKVLLGRHLFYEKALSVDNTVSCASCHHQAFAFSDTAQFSVGVAGSLGNRHSMALVNLAWHNNGFFWDGRASLLRHQVLMPIEDPLEMKETLASVIAKLKKIPGYPLRFAQAFGDNQITEERISFALEAFINSLVSQNSRFDQYLAGKIQLTASEMRGYLLFLAEYNEFFPEASGADCFHCHGSNQFQLNSYENNGLDFASEITDVGREGVTQNISDRAKFKVPTLRNVEVTAPYMHDGRFKTLEEVVEHYNNGIKVTSTVNGALQATSVTGLRLNATEKADLIAFLKSLTDREFLTHPKFSNPHP